MRSDKRRQGTLALPAAAPDDDDDDDECVTKCHSFMMMVVMNMQLCVIHCASQWDLVSSVELLNGETSDVRLMPKCLLSRVILIHHDYVRTHASRENSLRECLSAFQPS
jgi:hypothetical protein